MGGSATPGVYAAVRCGDDAPLAQADRPRQLVGGAATGSRGDCCNKESKKRQHHGQQLQGEMVGALRPRKRQCRKEEERGRRRQAEATGFGQAAHLGRIAAGQSDRELPLSAILRLSPGSRPRVAGLASCRWGVGPGR
jgi:hypothetical protein